MFLKVVLLLLCSADLLLKGGDISSSFVFHLQPDLLFYLLLLQSVAGVYVSGLSQGGMEGACVATA